MSVSGVQGGGYSDFIQQMLFLEGKPLRDLQAKRATHDVRLGILSDARTKINAFKSLLSSFAETGIQSALRDFKVSSSEEEVLTASADAEAQVGGHSISVSQLAQAHTVASSSMDPDGTVASSGTYAFDITVSGETTNVSVSVSSGDTNDTIMEKVVNAIRDTGVAVDASLLTVDTTTGEKVIVLKSQETGEDGSITEITDTTGSLMSDLGLAGTSSAGAFSTNTTLEGQNALFSVDGIDMVSGTNEVDGVMEGVVLNLKSPSYDAAGGEDPAYVDLKVEYDREGLKEKVEELFGAYNEMMEYLNQKMKSGDENGENRGELAGDLTFGSFRTEMKLALSRRLGADYQVGNINSLDDVGISLARDGKLSLSDEEAFFNALTSDPGAVEAYFGSDDGIFKRAEELVTAFTKIGGGLDLSRDLVDSKKDILDLRIERQENLLSIREEQLVQELGRLSQFVAQIGNQQQAFAGLIGF